VAGRRAIRLTAHPGRVGRMLRPQRPASCANFVPQSGFACFPGGHQPGYDKLVFGSMGWCLCRHRGGVEPVDGWPDTARPAPTGSGRLALPRQAHRRRRFVGPSVRRP
jgi:hypothetical protein